jgi:hypothetical protein
MRSRLVSAAATGWVSVALATTASAGPWAQAGDAQLRSDVEVLASLGAIDNITTQWPIPWAGLLDRLDSKGALDGLPDYARDAAQRVRERGASETKSGTFQTSIMMDFAGAPAVVRGFDALGRDTVQGQASVEYVSATTVVHLALGAKTSSKTDRQIFVPDGSYVAQRLGDTVVYAGYMSHWWGPGWISALSLSTNARPMPQIGISRISTAPFETWWLNWLGPWQAEFFVGVLDGSRIARNTIYDGFRFAFSPLPHLEIGFARTDMMCGTGHPCKPLVGWFDGINGASGPNIVNDEGTIDVRYSGAFGRWAYEVYTQAMNEDNFPFVKSASSHLFGGSVWVPYNGSITRLTVEYTDSRATQDLFGGSILHGAAYNNWQYADGMRYRGRTLGFSLDSDSRLLSVQAAFTDRSAWTYTFTYHHAIVSDPLNTTGNVVSSSPVTVNMVQARASLPLKLSDWPIHLDIEARLQDDQPRPDHGQLATIEIALRAGL